MITTLQQHILQHQTPGATGNFSWLLSGITLATKMIEAKIRRATLSGDLGSINQTNVHGENQQKLDVYANQALLHCLGVRDSVVALVSEENEEPVILDRSPETGKYVIVFDPLDGSSNIDVNVNVGTISRYSNEVKEHRRIRVGRFCSPEEPKSRPATFFTALLRYSFIRLERASMGSPLIQQSGPTF